MAHISIAEVYLKSAIAICFIFEIIIFVNIFFSSSDLILIRSSLLTSFSQHVYLLSLSLLVILLSLPLLWTRDSTLLSITSNILHKPSLINYIIILMLMYITISGGQQCIIIISDVLMLIEISAELAFFIFFVSLYISLMLQQRLSTFSLFSWRHRLSCISTVFSRCSSKVNTYIYIYI